jgi:dimethylargininase
MHPVISFDRALVRRPAPSVVRGLRAVDRGNPSFADLCAEHDVYVAALEAAGLAVESLDPLEEFPDSIFVEDPALTYGEGAILLRPGARSREGETVFIEPALRRNFPQVLRIAAGFADGGDVLNLADRVLIGVSARTDRAGAESLVACLAALGRKGEIVATPEGVLHFKTDCSLLDAETVLATPLLARSGVFAGLRQVLTPPGEEAAANALRVNDRVLVGARFPKTVALLDGLGFTLAPLATTEIGKIDAGLSCMSLRWKSQGE